MGRHSAAVTVRSRRPLIITVAGLVVLAVGGALVIRSLGGDDSSDGDLIAAGNCDKPINVTVAAAPELQPQIEAAAKTLQGRDDGGACATFKVSGSSPAAIAQAVATGDKHPDLWIPDSSLWVSQADDGQSLPLVAVPSLATSPLVIVGMPRSFANTSSWLGLFSGTQPAVLDPLSTGTGAVTLLAIAAERAKTNATDNQVAQVMVPLAQRHGSMAQSYRDIDGLFSRVVPGDTSIVVPASEQAFATFKEKHPESGLRAVVPQTGTLMLDYPLVVTAKENTDKVSEAGKRLAQELRSDASARALDEAGFRAATGEVLSGGRGIGDVTLLSKPEPAAAERVIQNWATLALSAHTLVVIDASSSMATKVAATKSWMDLTGDAAIAGMGLFPNNAEIGLWAISTKLGGANRDWAPLVPIRQLGARVGAGTQRDAILHAFGTIKANVGGSTGLYEAALAAYRTVQDSYDPRSINSVVIFTDGYSTNAGNLTLNDTLTSLQRLRDPARPVRIVAIGMGPDVDTASLGKLAHTTGGSSYLARGPGDIKNVFIDALKHR